MLADVFWALLNRAEFCSTIDSRDRDRCIDLYRETHECRACLATRLVAAAAGARPVAVGLARAPGRRRRRAIRTRRACILLWMTGGPSQIDTFDLKPGHANGGPFKEIATSVPGLRISEHLPKLAKHGRPPGRRPLDEHQGGRPRPRHVPDAHRPPAEGPIQLPDARLVARQGARTARRRRCRTSSASRPTARFNPAAFGPGFLGPRYAPLDRRRDATSLPAQRPTAPATMPS